MTKMTSTTMTPHALDIAEGFFFLGVNVDSSPP